MATDLGIQKHTDFCSEVETISMEGDRSAAAHSLMALAWHLNPQQAPVRPFHSGQTTGLLTHMRDVACLCVGAALKPAAVHFCSYVLSIRDLRSGEQRYMIAEHIIICHGILGRFYQPQVLHSTTAAHCTAQNGSCMACSADTLQACENLNAHTHLQQG